MVLSRGREFADDVVPEPIELRAHGCGVELVTDRVEHRFHLAGE